MIDFKNTYQELISGDNDFRRNAIEKLYIAFEISLKRNLQIKYPYVDSHLRKSIDSENKESTMKLTSPFVEEIIQIAFFKIIEKNLSPKSEYAIVGWLKDIVNKTASEEIHRFWRKFEVDENTQSNSASKIKFDYDTKVEELNKLSKIKNPSEKVKSEISRLKVQIIGIVKLITKGGHLNHAKASAAPYIMECIDETTMLFGLQYPDQASILMEYTVGQKTENKKPNNKNLQEIASIYGQSLSNIKKTVSTYSKLLKESLSECLD